MAIEGTRHMLKRLITVTAVVVALSISAVAPTAAQETDTCPHEPTIDALHVCVSHAEEQGHIDNSGIARSFHAKLDAAGASLDRGNTVVAENILSAFVRQLEAQAGSHVDSMAADHLRMHAEMVIDNLAA